MKYIHYILLISCLFHVPHAMAQSGKIWHVAGQKFISHKVLVKNLMRSDKILIGLQQDNPAHHMRAAKIIENLVKKGKKPVILLSNVERSKQNAFAIFTQRHRKTDQNYDATGLDMLLEWSDSGPLAWHIARPVFDMAMVKKLPLKAVNFSRYEIGQLHQGDLPQDVKKGLLPLLKIKTQIEQDMSTIHCDVLPPEVLAKFALIHRARNGLFALSIADIRPEMAVLITDQDHIYKDTGVPRYLSELPGAGKSISLLFVETGQDMSDRQVDYIWYTKKFSRPDPCSLTQPVENEAWQKQ